MPFWKKKALVSQTVQDAVVSAIREAEALTTGEIRVFMEPHCQYMDALDRCRELFAQLGMDQTEERNAILIYLAISDKQFALFGDIEIYHRAGGPEFWKRAAQVLRAGLKTGAVEEGMLGCITELGKALAQHFPFNPNIERNELPDEIVFGK
ncbi:MAG: TPM domain-containing protein [Bacteroidetes bacterium]|nr:TPM domain-containing protein [Bacteroidota bacterium]